MIKLYAYTSKKKKVKIKDKIKKDITKYLAKINKRKSRLIIPVDLAMTEKIKEFKNCLKLKNPELTCNKTEPSGMTILIKNF